MISIQINSFLLKIKTCFAFFSIIFSAYFVQYIFSFLSLKALTTVAFREFRALVKKQTI